MWRYYNKLTNFITNKFTENINYNLIDPAKKYALKKFVKSDYLKDTTTILPLTILTIFTRGIFNFLITSRLKTDLYFIDLPISVGITVFLTLSSPFLYNLFEKSFKTESDDLSTYVINSFYKDGWVFLEYWKTRILGTSGIVIILTLFFVEINSRMIQEFIFHTLISSSLVDYINRSEGINKDRNKDNLTVRIKRLSSPNMIESYYPENNMNLFVNSEKSKVMIIDDYSR
tara:strand:- start:930 stop:1619 length:690 start_codon:yes stop_codon:yes gene_type:complete